MYDRGGLVRLLAHRALVHLKCDFLRATLTCTAILRSKQAGSSGMPGGASGWAPHIPGEHRTELEPDLTNAKLGGHVAKPVLGRDSGPRRGLARSPRRGGNGGDSAGEALPVGDLQPGDSDAGAGAGGGAG